MLTEGDERGNAILHGSVEQLTTAATAIDAKHVGIITDTSVREWHRATSSGMAAMNDKHVVKVGGEFREVQSAGGVSTRQMGPDLTVTTAGAPIGESWTAAVEEAIEGEDRAVVAIENPRFLLCGDDPAARVEELGEFAEREGIHVHVALPSEDVNVGWLSRHVECADESVRERLTADGVAHLRERDPTNFGYLRSNWREARRGLEATEMTYPQSKQIHSSIPDPETTPRTLGAALQGFVELGALDVWGDTVAANRYDMTGYDPERAAAVGDAIEDADDDAE